MRPIIVAASAAAVALVGATLTTTAQAVPTSGLPGFCDLAPDNTVNVWTGAVSEAWENPGNWSDPAGYPGLGGGDEDVCIPTGGTPVIDSGEEQHLRTLDIAKDARITINEGGKLFLYGDQAAGEDSVVRRGGSIQNVGGTIGGNAHLHVLGTLLMANVGSFASTLLTRDCSYDTDGNDGPEYPGEEPCTSPVPTPVSGQTMLVEVDDYGLLDMVGGGINLGDQSRVIVRGVMRVDSVSYVAADHGVRVALRPHRTALPGTGTLRFEGDGGFLEGKITADTGIASLATLDNRGLVLKADGTGRTLVTAAYTQPSPGRVSVRSGTLLLPSGPVTPAYVEGGATYGTGRCAEANDPACVPTTTPSFRQSADLRVSTADTNGARVKVRKLATKSTAADLGLPFDVHATGMTAGPVRPAIIRLRYDASVLGGKTWNAVKIYRKSGTNPYRYVKACTSTGRPPTGEVACVDRRGLAGSSRNIANTSGAPDVLMVVRTTATSRWVGR